MEAARASWTDSRMDDLKETVVGIDEKVTSLDKKVDEGFVRLDKKVDDGFVRLDRKVDQGYARLDGKIDGGLGRIDDRIDALHHSLVYGMVALISVIAILLAAFLTVVATQI
jgi:hypothetical protein